MNWRFPKYHYERGKGIRTLCRFIQDREANWIPNKWQANKPRPARIVIDPIWRIRLEGRCQK